MSFIDRYIDEQLQNDPEFKKAWEETEAAFQVAQQVIRLRKENGWTQQELAERLGTTQSVISRIENMENVSVEYLGRIARTFGRRLKIEMVDEEEASTVAHEK
jgi:transcriptional regulator with XRE-family HTH domain